MSAFVLLSRVCVREPVRPEATRSTNEILITFHTVASQADTAKDE